MTIGMPQKRWPGRSWATLAPLRDAFEPKFRYRDSAFQPKRPCNSSWAARNRFKTVIQHSYLYPCEGRHRGRRFL